MTNGPAVASADPGSVNLATYLSALGLDFKPETIAQWLALIPVLALEAGSALAGLLVQAVGRPSSLAWASIELAVRKGAPKAPEQEASERDRVANAIVELICKPAVGRYAVASGSEQPRSGQTETQWAGRSKALLRLA